MSENKTGRKCSICEHADKQEINRMIFDGKAFRAISRQFSDGDSMRDAISRHAENCLKADLKAVIRENRLTDAVNVYEEFRQMLNDTQRLHRACVNWLTNPTTGEIDLNPRAFEIDVIYLDYADKTANGEPKRKNDTLQKLIERTEQTNRVGFVMSEAKTADIRKLILDTVKQSESLLDKFAKIQGTYAPEKVEVKNESAEMLRRGLQVFVKLINKPQYAEEKEKAARILINRISERIGVDADEFAREIERAEVMKLNGVF